MLLQLDFAAETPIYRQIHDQLILGIAEGHLLPGEKLPAIRALANETGVNMMTVNKAYQLLKQEGYITGDRRGGTVVSGKTPEMSEKSVLDDLRLPAASAKLAGMSLKTWLGLCEKAFRGI
ncbi:MAG: GntR family transcriptional regulator [Treponema sp.]|nr:GntR family transcriptional regulator [Treponema sp.]